MSCVNVETLLFEGVEESYEKFHNADPGSEEYKATLNASVQLTDRAIELYRIELEQKEKEAARESERLAQKRQNKIEILKWAGGIAVAAVGSAAQMFFTNRMVNKSMEFEKTDTFTSTAGREYNKFSIKWPFKK